MEYLKTVSVGKKLEWRDLFPVADSSKEKSTAEDRIHSNDVVHKKNITHKKGHLHKAKTSSL